MKLQDYMIDVTRKAADEAFRYAAAVPAEKLDWKPLDSGRSVLDLCREMAMCPGWAVDIIEGKERPEFNEATMEAIKKEQEQWTSVADCKAECDRRLAGLFDVFKNMSDARLADTKWLPFDGGRDFTMPEMMDYPRWNFTYHLGQIAYIQVLFGDMDMH